MNPIIYEHEAHKLAQPTCRYCGLPLRWGKGYGHVDGFEETGVCGSRWFPDFQGLERDEWSRSSACREIVRLRISQLKRMADSAMPILRAVEAAWHTEQSRRSKRLPHQPVTIPYRKYLRIAKFMDRLDDEIERLRALK